MLKKSLFGILFAALAVVAWNLTAQAADSKALYDKQCKTCHGPDGTGNAGYAKMKKLTPEETVKLNLVTSKMPEADVEKVILKGAGKMGAMDKKMTPEEAKALATYSKGLQK